MLHQWFWGNLTSNDQTRFTLLGLTAFLLSIVDGFTHELYQPLTINILGANYQPLLQMYGTGCLILLGIIYLFLAGLRNKATLFYIIMGFYGIIFTALTIMFMLDTLLPIGKFSAAAFYIATQSLPIIALTMFWSIIINTSTIALAKQGYHLIIIALILGSIVGKIGSTFGVMLLGSAILVMIPICIGTAIMLMKSFFNSFHSPTIKLTTDAENKTMPYLIALGSIVLLSNCVLQILNYQTYDIIRRITDEPFGFSGLIKLLNGFRYYHAVITLGSLLFAFFAFRILLKKFTISTNLFITPLLSGAFFLCLWVLPQMSYIPIIISIMIMIINKTLTEPILELLFIPTNVNAQFRIKALIMFAIPLVIKPIAVFINEQIDHSALMLGQINHSLLFQNTLILIGSLILAISCLKKIIGNQTKT